jgi:hypothetical protein
MKWKSQLFKQKFPLFSAIYFPKFKMVKSKCKFVCFLETFRALVVFCLFNYFFIIVGQSNKR